MQMNLRSGGDFTTNASVVDQISKRQDVCRVSSKMPTTPLSFRSTKVTTRRRFIVYYLSTVFDCYDIKIASEGEGRKPSSDREKYVAESELALLSILSNQCLMIYFYLDSSEQHGEKQK